MLIVYRLDTRSYWDLGAAPFSRLASCGAMVTVSVKKLDCNPILKTKSFIMILQCPLSSLVNNRGGLPRTPSRTMMP